MAVWNAAFILSGLLLIALAGEVYFRLTKPFLSTNVSHFEFVDGVGLIREPNAEVRYGRRDDEWWAVQRANSQGFLDREPVRAERAAAGCRIVFIGDSYVEAREVPIADKFHVRLEDMAARELPHLDITTQAYGISGTGQINQLPFYDEYARRLSPKLVVLVFYRNDFGNNLTALKALNDGWDPDRLPYMSAQRDENGALKLRPPDAEYERFMLPRPPKAWYVRVRDRLAGVSYFAKWTSMWLWKYDFYHQYEVSADMIAAHPCCASLMDGLQSDTPHALFIVGSPFKNEHLPPVYEEALAYTAFGIERFKRRVERDGAKLAIIAATSDMGTHGDPQFDRLIAIAEPRGIPVISHYDYMVSRGYNPSNGRWRDDIHWNAIGHQWVAEAVLEWLKANPDVCD